MYAWQCNCCFNVKRQLLLQDLKLKPVLSNFEVIAGSLESANSSILAVHNLFKDFGGQKNQDFMLIRLNYACNMIGCGGDMHG